MQSQLLYSQQERWVIDEVMKKKHEEFELHNLVPFTNYNISITCRPCVVDSSGICEESGIESEPTFLKVKTRPSGKPRPGTCPLFKLGICHLQCLLQTLPSHWVRLNSPLIANLVTLAWQLFIGRCA
jgi:hypothetical protein